MDAISRAVVALEPTRAQRALLVLTLTSLLVMMIWERRRPAYATDYRRTWKRDLAVQVLFSSTIAPLALLVNRYVSFAPVLPQSVFTLPFVMRAALYLIIADFGHYWVHRAMHSKWLWHVHRWHHSPTYMYWLMGARGSFLQQTLVNIPYIFAQALLVVSPWWTGLAIVFKNGVQNNWMHLNVSWGPRWLEWFIVTPRYHHIHHSDNPEYYGANIAPLFPIWDRLFGTYVDPDKVAGHLNFGTNEKAPRWRLALGL
ncbi:MAG TPA: sterol desaturase family protein [Steroidobacteraceae bacterium]|nr:sterol desaturase family protein [Steroidobacteraceae bacterium]